MTEDEMVGWHHRLNGHEFEQAPWVGDGQEAWCATVHEVTKSQTWLSDWTELMIVLFLVLWGISIVFSMVTVSMLLLTVQLGFLFSTPSTEFIVCRFFFYDSHSDQCKVMPYWIYLHFSNNECPIFLPFHTVHGVLKERILKWFAIPFSNGPRSVRPLHPDPSVLDGPTQHGLLSLSYTRLCF